MTDALTGLLFDAGLIQFGWFAQEAGAVPFHFSLDMLPSYPPVLQTVIEMALPAVQRQRIDHLLCTPDALPLGVGLSLATGVPLVYSRGGHADAVHDLVGAYDIGHPALLVTTVLDSGASAQRLMTHARRVGLEVHTVFTILDLGIAPMDDVAVISLLRLEEVIDELAGHGDVPPAYVNIVLEWLAQQRVAG